MAEQKSSSALTAPLRGAASALRRVPGAGPVGRAAEETLDRIGAVSPRGRRIAVYAGAGVLGVTGVVEWPVALTGAAVAWLTRPRPETERAATDVGEERTPTDTAEPAERTQGETHGPVERTPTDTAEPAERTPAEKAAIQQAVMDKAVTEGAVEEKAVSRGRAERTEPAHDLGSAALRSSRTNTEPTAPAQAGATGGSGHAGGGQAGHTGDSSDVRDPGATPSGSPSHPKPTATDDTHEAHDTGVGTSSSNATGATPPPSHHKPEVAHDDAPPPSPKHATGPLGPTARPGRTVL